MGLRGRIKRDVVQLVGMDRGRGDRPGFPGLRVATGRGDLIEDIHRQQRRRVLKRAAQLTALAIALLLVGVAFKVIKDRRARALALETAYERFIRGTAGEIDVAVKALEQSIEQDPEHAPTLVAHGLARAHLLLEFGVGEPQARAAIAELPEAALGAGVARGMLAFVDGELELARDELEGDRAREGSDAPAGPFVVSERAFLEGWLVVASHPDDPEQRAAIIGTLEGRLSEAPQQVAVRRLLALVHLLGGDPELALSALSEAREYGRAHMGLSADEALYNAYLRQELSGVASVADQLLGTEAGLAGLSPRDRAHAQLARAVVHVHSGEVDDGLALLDRAFEGLPPWDRLSRRLAIQTALEAGDASRTEGWVEQTGLPESEGEVYEAWAVLVRGDVMDALRRLAGLPQRDPWVGYLQALALVEQGRHGEASAWVERTEKLLPGRMEIEVARARVELRQGDKAVALRKLQVLAEEEARAPRAFTGLGEAYLLQEEPDLRLAKKALERALEREALPAEAMLLLAKVWDRRRGKDPRAERKARELLEKAAKANPHLPRYREELALYLVELAFPEEARALMEPLVDEAGVRWPLLLRLVELQAKDGGADYDPEPLLTKASERGAPADAVLRLRARIDLESGDKARLGKAQEALQGRLAQDPKDVEARVLYAQTFLKQFDRKAADSTIRKGLAAVDDDKDGRLLLAWAQLDVRAGKQRIAAPRARRAFGDMLEEGRPARELLDAGDLASRLFLRQGKERTALAVAKQLTGRLGYHSQAWIIRAKTELGAGEAQAARESAQRAIELDPQSPRAHEIHGHALLRFGYKDKARAAYDKAVELAKGTPQEKDYRANFKRL